MHTYEYVGAYHVRVNEDKQRDSTLQSTVAQTWKMPPKKKIAPTKAIPPSSARNSKDLSSLAGYLITCDVPTKQYILYLNELKPVDKKFVLEDLDATHLLVKKKAREEIEGKVDAWMDENVFSGKQGMTTWKDRLRFDCLSFVFTFPRWF
jgi:TFIIH basal transcription factor complex TTD-A subunit